LPARSYPPVSARRDRELKLRVTADELDALKERAALAKRTPSDFLRIVVLSELGQLDAAREPQETA
jgi:hypothetical protein